MATYLITGASRGIGLEFVKQILVQQPGSKVIAGVRRGSKELLELYDTYPQSLTLVSLDVDNTASVYAAAHQIACSHPEGVDYIINNAGILGCSRSDPDDFSVYNTNVAGPFRVISAFLPLLQKGSKKIVLNISSIMGSITQQRNVQNFVQAVVPGSNYLNYRISKAGLNAAVTALAAQYKYDEIALVSINPGLVTTDFIFNMYGAPDVVSSNAISPQKSVAAMLKVLHKLSVADTAKFYNFDGSIMAW